MTGCQFEKESRWSQFFTHLFVPLLVAVVTGYIAWLVADKGNEIVNRMNKSSLLKDFKSDIIKGEGPEFILAEKALKEYFPDEEWANLKFSIIQSKGSTILDAIQKNNPESGKKAFKAIESIISAPDFVTEYWNNNPSVKIRYEDSSDTMLKLKGELQKPANRSFLDAIETQSGSLSNWLKSDQVFPTLSRTAKKP
jgi:hypothetical protein